ncbi:MAG: hypothetical protein R3F11_04785 [Verrucomicrobiales bacterium]
MEESVFSASLKATARAGVPCLAAAAQIPDFVSGLEPGGTPRLALIFLRADPLHAPPDCPLMTNQYLPPSDEHELPRNLAGDPIPDPPPIAYDPVKRLTWATFAVPQSQIYELMDNGMPEFDQSCLGIRDGSVRVVSIAQMALVSGARQNLSVTKEFPEPSIDAFILEAMRFIPGVYGEPAGYFWETDTSTGISGETADANTLGRFHFLPPQKTIVRVQPEGAGRQHLGEGSRELWDRRVEEIQTSVTMQNGAATGLAMQLGPPTPAGGEREIYLHYLLPWFLENN